MERPIITTQETQLSYAKYFHRPLADIPQEKLDIWNGQPAAPELVLPFEDRARVQSAQAPGLSCGYAVAANGTGFVANTTFMPGVTPEMFNWWFGWHAVTSDLRYKIWDPEDHYFARADKPDYVRDPAVPLAEKTWGVSHSILEDVGLGADKLMLCFTRPSELGYDDALVGTPDCRAMVCAYGVGGLPAVMTHIAREAEGGILFCSRFWLGYGPGLDGGIGIVIPKEMSIPAEVPRALFGHNIKEFTNLAAILPALYAEEKDKPW